MRFLRRPTPEIKDARLLDLRPDDRIVVEVSGRINVEQAKEIQGALACNLNVPFDQVIVIANGTLRILRDGDPPPPPVVYAPEARYP